MSLNKFQSNSDWNLAHLAVVLLEEALLMLNIFKKGKKAPCNF